MKSALKKIKKSLGSFFRDLYWRYYGPTFVNPEIPEAPARILFICKGNVCRSPFAECASGKIFSERGMQGVSFQSAGLEVSLSLPPPDLAVEVAQRMGVSLKGHRSVGITEEMVKSADMLIVMEAWHIQRLRGLYPAFRDKMFLLPLFRADLNPTQNSFYRFNISDPYGADRETYLAAFARIEECLQGLLDQMQGKG